MGKVKGEGTSPVRKAVHVFRSFARKIRLALLLLGGDMQHRSFPCGLLTVRKPIKEATNCDC